MKVSHILPFAAWGNKAERVNLIVCDALKVVQTDDTPWYQYLPYIQLVMNASFNRNLKTSPFMIMHGRNPILPTDLLVLNPEIKIDYREANFTPLSYAKQLHNKLIRVNKLISKRIIQEKFTSHSYRDKNMPEDRTIEIGDIVMIKLPLKPEVSAKLNSTWLGYYVVINVLETKITVQTLGGRQTYNLHANMVLKVNTDFEQKFNTWNEGMTKYSAELKKLELPTEEVMDTQGYISGQKQKKRLDKNVQTKPNIRVGKRKNIYTKKTNSQQLSQKEITS